MMRTVHDGAFLIVEGVDDIRFWKTRRHDSCELVNGEGKPNVVGAIDRLDAKNTTGVLGIVDEDYDSLMGIRHKSRNLLTTGSHDLECVLCRSSALDVVLAEFGVASKIQAYEEQAGKTVRSGLLRRAMVFGRLRWAAIRHKLEIDVAAIRVPQFVDIKTWNVDGDELFRVVSRTASPHTFQVLKRRTRELPTADPWLVVRGHDMIQILRIGLMRVLGQLPASTGTKDITRVLRAAMSREELRRTTLWTEVRTWEHNNSHFILSN